jgi:hypothetical protein
MAEIRLGQLLLETGVLTLAQVRNVLREQERTGAPFGLLCEQLYHIQPETIERAWATQYATLTRMIDPLSTAIDARALELITRRQAWQFRVLPICFDGSELMLATTQQHLRRALRFAVGVIGVPVFLVLATPQKLGEALCKLYPLPGMTPGSVDDHCMDTLLK